MFENAAIIGVGQSAYTRRPASGQSTHTFIRDAVVAALADQATSAGEALMPAFTHFRFAQPILVAHFFLAHAAAELGVKI